MYYIKSEEPHKITKPPYFLVLEKIRGFGDIFLSVCYPDVLGRVTDQCKQLKESHMKITINSRNNT